MPANKKSTTSEKKSISINGDVRDSAVIIGDNNTVNQTIIQKFFNIFKSDSETLEQRNRRILLNHVENAWIKGVLDASLHGTALLDLGIKQDPEAVTKYPWAIKKESTTETLPAGTSMLEIFDSIGMGRSLLILGAPGSGKTTMLLELARQMIACAREDVTYPIPIVFNLASWTEKLTLADWLAQELNNLYSVPRKTAPDWGKGNKLLLLLDGLDEVRQESRAKCVEAINVFRKEHGLTSLAVCSRSQDYADLNAKLSFEGAIEVQPLTQGQIVEFFNRFGKEMAGIKQVLKKDSALREMAESPLFLSIMMMAYRDRRDIDIFGSGGEKARRKHLVDSYIERMFERRTENESFKKQDLLRQISWLASKLFFNNTVHYLVEDMQPQWLGKKKQKLYGLMLGVIAGVIIGLIIGLIFGLIGELIGDLISWLTVGLIVGVIGGIIIGSIEGLFNNELISESISTVDSLSWNWEKARKGSIDGLVLGLIVGLIGGLIVGLIGGLVDGLFYGLIYGLTSVLFSGVFNGLNVKQLSQITYPGQKLVFSAKNFLFVFIVVAVFEGVFALISGSIALLIGAIIVGMLFGLNYGGMFLIQHYTLRLILARNNLLPWRLVPFLDHCVDLIFLRRVGGGYIFVHRLLMEHFAEMYVEKS